MLWGNIVKKQIFQIKLENLSDSILKVLNVFTTAAVCCANLQLNKYGVSFKMR